MQVPTQPHRSLRETVLELGVMHGQALEVFGDGDQEFPESQVVAVRPLEESQLVVLLIAKFDGHKGRVLGGEV